MVGVVPASRFYYHEVLVFDIFLEVLSVSKVRVSPPTQAAGYALAFWPRSFGCGNSGKFGKVVAVGCHFMCQDCSIPWFRTWSIGLFSALSQAQDE